MNKSYVITPDKYPTRVNTDRDRDRDHDGGTVGSLHKLENGVELQCDFERTYSLPFCEIEFVISTQDKGLDLSTFDSVTITKKTQGFASTFVITTRITA